jgi:hypothetical protein
MGVRPVRAAVSHSSRSRHLDSLNGQIPVFSALSLPNFVTRWDSIGFDRADFSDT